MSAALKQYVLLNPGPACTTPTVRQAMVTPDLCHREPEFFQVMRRVREEIAELAGGGREWSTVIFSGSGTAAVEAAVTSVVPEDRKLLVVDNGVYGDRIAQMAAASRIPHQVLRYSWTEPPKPADVEQALAADPTISHLAVVHHETTTGLLNPVQELAAVCRRAGRSILVDAMSSFGGEPLDVKQDGIDYLVSSSNKCLQGMPGLSFVVARRACLEQLGTIPPRSVYLNLYNQWKSEEADNTPFTPAIQVFFALQQALDETHAEGLAARCRRYREAARTLRTGAEALGLAIVVPEPWRSHTLTTFRLPEGIRYDPLHDAMKQRGYIIYAGQGDLKSWAFRIANLGTLTPKDMEGVVAALGESLAELRA
ncbi:MAG: 2-aminoethylphosphonate--pyruvate transaminase [Armatimonadetes bacterium]|nr:2-aminoethylphosphonate--pyruvate transaminase [Armatimonadota bacterium]